MRAGERVSESGLRLVCRVGAHSPLLFLISILVNVSQIANAADWPRLPDGRIVVEMNGVRLAFPASGDRLKDIHFNTGSKERSMTLQQVLESPDRAREAFAGKRNSVGFAVSSPTGLILEHFVASEYQGFGFAIVTGPGSQGICQTIERQVADARDQIANGKLTVGADGLATVKLSGKSPDILYVVADPTRTASPRIDHLQCDALSTCGASICVGSNISVDFHFPEKLYQRATWQDVLRRTNDILNFVLIDNTTGAGGK